MLAVGINNSYCPIIQQSLRNIHSDDSKKIISWFMNPNWPTAIWYITLISEKSLEQILRSKHSKLWLKIGWICSFYNKNQFKTCRLFLWHKPIWNMKGALIAIQSRSQEPKIQNFEHKIWQKINLIFSKIDPHKYDTTI